LMIFSRPGSIHAPYAKSLILNDVFQNRTQFCFRMAHSVDNSGIETSALR